MEHSELKRTALYDIHIANGATMVPFCGYQLPLQYERGIKEEHLYCRSVVGLFDVSHMGQAEIIGDDFYSAAYALEKIVPSNIANLKPNQMRYTVLLNEEGGIEDDLIVTHRIKMDGSSRLGLVVNAARRSHDYAYISSALEDDLEFKIEDDRALIALQGPDAAKIMAIWCGSAIELPYMREIETTFFDVPCRVSRSGYTGEDGFEISMLEGDVVRVTEMLLSHGDVKLIGLGARDSLRLEAGFCLYGHDIDDKTTPVEASLEWIIGKQRQAEMDFIGAHHIVSQLENGPKRRRVGLLPVTRSAPAREGALIFNLEGKEIGRVTSGAFGPSVDGPIAMGYVSAQYSQLGNIAEIEIRDRRYKWRVSDLPFTPSRTVAKSKITKH